MSRSAARGTAASVEQPPDFRSRLRAFAIKNTLQRGPQCQTCMLPVDVRVAVREEHDVHGTGWRVISEAIAAEGHKATSVSLQHHFREGHEQRQG